MPRISIILPSYKDAPLLAKAMASVSAQDLSDWELIIVDDGLTATARKNLHALAEKDPRIVVIENEKNLGIQKSLNRGLGQARGEFIARLDDDDVWIDTNKLSKQVSFLEQHPEHVLVGTNAAIVDEAGKTLGTYAMPKSDEAIRERILSKNCFLHPTIMARKSAVEKAGAYDETEETKHIEDYALWLKLGRIGKFANLPDSTTELTIHSQSMTAQNRITQVRRMKNIIWRYRNKYPCFVFGYVMLTLRSCVLRIFAIIPFPKVLLYRLQALYKKI